MPVAPNNVPRRRSPSVSTPSEGFNRRSARAQSQEESRRNHRLCSRNGNTGMWLEPRVSSIGASHARSGQTVLTPADDTLGLPVAEPPFARESYFPTEVRGFSSTDSGPNLVRSGVGVCTPPDGTSSLPVHTIPFKMNRLKSSFAQFL